MMSETEWVLRGVALVEAALNPGPLLAPKGDFLQLISDLDGEPPLTLIVAVLSVIASMTDDFDPIAVRASLARIRKSALNLN